MDLRPGGALSAKRGGRRPRIGYKLPFQGKRMKISSRMKWTILGTVLAALLLSLGAVGAFGMAVRRDPDHQFTREAIMQILSKESTVYYSDGKTKVGTFFEGQHRDYVPF